MGIEFVVFMLIMPMFIMLVLIMLVLVMIVMPVLVMIIMRMVVGIESTALAKLDLVQSMGFDQRH